MHDDATSPRPSAGLTADQLVDELIPDNLDWQRLVRSYPLSSVAVATAAGFLLGRNHGAALVGAVSAYAVRQVSHNLTSVLGDPAPADEV